MKLPIPFIRNKKENNEHYLALLLDDEKAGSVILHVDLGKAKTIGQHVEHLPNPLETIPQEELINIIDRTISRAEEVLPPNIETHKTVFGVKANWIEKETKKIKKEYLTKLKKVCDALDLTPIGFMVITEAIANLIQEHEGAPLSAIIVELGQKNAALTLFRGGKIVEEVNAPIEDSIPQTVDKLLKRFTTEVLPARIILFSTKNPEHHAQQFINHTFSKSLPFLHLPQVMHLPAGYDARAVTYGACQQMGFELTDPMPKIEAEKTIQHGEKPEDKENTPEIPPVVPVGGDNFGFVANADISKVDQSAPVLEGANKDAESNEVNPDEEQPAHVNLHQNHAGEEKNEFAPAQSRLTKNKLFASASGLFHSIPLPKMPPLPGFLAKNKQLKLPLIIAGGLLLFIIGLMLFYHYNTRAQIDLSVKPEIVQETSEITFSTSGSSDFSQNILAAKPATASIDGELSIDTTGKKDVGEEAKGNVTIFNSEDEKATLSRGTEIKAGDRTFVLDRDVEIKAASGDIFTGTKPGTAQVSVTAREIGSESNLPSDTRFTVGGNSTLAARNESAFSGGNKKTVTVVSKKDLDKLRSDLIKDLEKNAVEELSKTAGEGETVLPVIVSTDLSNEKFDKKVDDEAKKVTLSATVEFIGMAYDNEQLADYSKSILKDKYSQDIAFAQDSLKTEVKDVKNNNEEEIVASLGITAGLLPEIDTSEVANKLQGKSYGQAKETLGSLPQIAKSDIKYSPNLFFVSRLFPKLPKNIIVTVKSE